MNIGNYQFFTNIDKKIALLVVFLFLVVTIVSYILLGNLKYVLFGSLIILFSIIWLKYRNRASIDLSTPMFQSRSFFLISQILFCAVFVTSILSLYYRQYLYERPLVYILLLSLLISFTAMEILFFKRINIYLTLFKIMILGISLVWSQILITPGLIGIDPWYHMNLTSIIVQYGFVPANYSYSFIPIFHILIGSTILLTGFDYKLSSLFSAGLVQPLCNMLFIYLLTYYIFKNNRISLLASLLIIIANNEINMNLGVIPNGFAGLFIPIILYLICKMKDLNEYRYIIMLIIISLALIFCHTVTSLAVIIIFFSLWMVSLLYKKIFKIDFSKFSILLPITFFIGMILVWISSGSLVMVMSFLVSEDVVTVHKDVLNYMNTVPVFEGLSNEFATFLFYAASLTGVYFMLARKDTNESFSIAVVGLIFLSYSYLSSFIGQSATAHRWLYFSQILLSIPLAVSIVVITQLMKDIKYLHVIIFIIFTFFTFMMISSPPANNDNHLLSPNSAYTISFTESELASMNTISLHSSNATYTDNLFSANMGNAGYNTSSFDDEIYLKDFVDSENKIFVLRENILYKPFKLYANVYRLDYDLKQYMNDLDFNEVYNNGMVSGLWQSG